MLLRPMAKNVLTTEKQCNDLMLFKVLRDELYH